MDKEMFEALMTNVRNRARCDLISHTKALFNVSKGMDEEQLTEYIELLLSKGIAYREYGHVYIKGIKEELK